MKLHLIHESIQIRRFDPEDEFDEQVDVWAIADEADRIAKDSGIRISSDKELTFVAMAGDEVAGAVWSSFTRDCGSDEYVYSFDVAVDPKMRGVGLVTSRIGPKLIDSALADYKERASQVDGAYIRCWVVNPKLARYLEANYGFESEGRNGEWSLGAPHMTYR